MSQPASTEPFRDSRRLTGCNLYFDGTGAALESVPDAAFDDAAVARWRDNIAEARAALGWPGGEVYVRRHASGVSLAFEAPMDQLYTATEAGEWAFYDALGLRAATSVEGEGGAPPRAHAGALPRAEALALLAALARREAKPALRALQAAAAERDLTFLPDDDAVSIGAGAHAQLWTIDALPAVDTVDWARLRRIPTALVTGSNGKTTVVRLLAAMLRAQGLHTSHSCTEGVYFDNALVEGGDYSGPGGARAALRHPHAQAAVLETARGGILRRGLALCGVDAAVVTNISADHYGEYGVHGLEDLAAAKLVVARAVRADALLVLNADDAVLRKLAPSLGCPVGWFGADFDDAFLAAIRGTGGATCGVRAGRLVASYRGSEVALGEIAAMPVTLGGHALYNVANAAAATLAALALRVPEDAIRATLSVFGTAMADNPGRLQAWRFADAHVVVDYAHNPEGLHGLLRAVGAHQRSGRMSILLGHAGNREDSDLRAVAATVAQYRPEHVVLKDIHGYERGRAPGEVAAIMRQSLLDGGIDAGAIDTQLDEADAAHGLLRDLRPGELLVLPLHDTAARDAVVETLEAMRAGQWRPGDALPERADRAQNQSETA
jgi:cyanophycin synthetase